MHNLIQFAQTQCILWSLIFVSLRILDFPDVLDGKESTFNVGDLGSIPELGRSLG